MNERLEPRAITSRKIGGSSNSSEQTAKGKAHTNHNSRCTLLMASKLQTNMLSEAAKRWCVVGVNE